MTFVDWLSTTAGHIRDRNRHGLADSAYQLYAGAWRRFGRMYNYGTPIFKEEWDILVVLDACRWDLMAEVTDDYAFLTDETKNSLGSATEEWLAKNFTPEYAAELERTAFVTGNPHSSEGLDESMLRHVEEVWQYAWDDELRTVPPRPVTDQAIRVAREMNPGRLIVHYMQPHHPFVPTPELNEGIGFFENAEWNHIWERLRHGAVSYEDVWRGYRLNLELVLEDVKLLLNNVNADTAVVTADHGNAMGEYGIYGHPLYVPIPALKKVPWCVTSAEDTGEYQPALKPETKAESSDSVVEERLKHLGYA
jgi:hypothetical protein